MVEVRIATPLDAENILEIYAPYVLSHATTFEIHVPTIEDFRQRISQILLKFPWIVCYINNSLAGYTYASPFKEREAYQWSAECSVYLSHAFMNKGIGRVLYKTLFPILKHQGIRNVFAGITLPNDPSVRLHEKLGFKSIAVYENIGYKLGHWHNVGWWKLQLNEYSTEPPPFLKFSQFDPNQFLPDLHRAENFIGSINH